MINTQNARVGRIFPSSGELELSTLLTPTSGLQQKNAVEMSENGFFSSQNTSTIK